MNQAMTGSDQVLLVDDDADILAELTLSLRSSGIRCLTATTGRDALRQLRENEKIQVLITDLRMPQIDGFALAQATQDLFPTRRRPRIIFISGHATPETILESLRHKPVDLLRKPFRARDLVQRVEEAMALAVEDRRREEAITSIEFGVGNLTAELATLSEQIASIQDRNAPDDSTPENVDKDLAASVATLLQIRNQRNRVFPVGLFSDPGWDMLLDLTENYLAGQSTYVSGLAVGAGVPLTTALRHLEALAGHGLIRRFQDPLDRRRMLTEITPGGIKLMAAAIISTKPNHDDKH